MKKILLLISQQRDKDEALSRCLEAAKGLPGAEVRAIYVLDEHFGRKYESLLSESTFVADKPGEDVCRALADEYRARAEKVLKTVESRCADLRVPYRTELRAGDYFDTARDLCREWAPDLVVVSERQNSFLARALGFSDRRKLSKFTNAEILAF